VKFTVEDAVRVQRDLHLGRTHVAYVDLADGMVLAHTDRERASDRNLEDCEVHQWLAGAYGGTDCCFGTSPGWYEVAALHEIRGLPLLPWTMPLTHHPVRLFRLSCGCLREYPMMPVSIQHVVLCATCRVAALTVFAYPDKCCGARGLHARFALSCTLEAAECDGTWHFDAVAGTPFTTRLPRLTQRREGKTGRA
jgi:hypothetical protein